MEERIIDNEREIKIKRKREGMDAVDALSDEAEGEEELSEEELILEIPEGEEYDEELVGLTPTQLKEELARRERAIREAREACEKLTAEGEEKLAAGAYEEAEELFAAALSYDAENVNAGKALWLARTERYTKDDAFFRDTYAEEFAALPDEVRESVLGGMGESLRAQREELRREEAPLREEVEGKQAERREAFRANRAYYLRPFGICFALFAVFLLGLGISAGFLYRTTTMIPIILMGVFGGLAFVLLIATVVLSRKVLVADRLCRENEKLSSTKEGARLAVIEEKLRCLDLVLGE